MKKAFVLIALFVPFCLFLSACQGYREIDSEYLITAIGFCEKEAKFTVYAEVLEVAAEKKDTKSELFCATGKTPFEAVENIAGLLPKKAVFDHCGTAIIGSEITGKDFKKIIKYLYDAKNLNLGICLYCAGEIEEILSLKPRTTSIGYDIMAIKNNLEKTTGISFKNKYYEICDSVISKKGFCLPEITAADDNPEISAQTVYVNFLPVYSLDKSELTLFNLLLYGSGGGEMAAGGKKCRFNKISTDITEKNGAVTVRMHLKYRSEKHRASAQLAKETENLLLKLKKTPAAGLVFPGFTAKSRVKVKVYDR